MNITLTANYWVPECEYDSARDKYFEECRIDPAKSPTNWGAKDHFQLKAESEYTTCDTPADIGSRSPWLGYDKTITLGETEPLAHAFEGLVTKWREETRVHSSLGKIFMHPSYQAIIGLGWEGLPFVLRAMRDTTEPWFYALKLMAREDVAKGLKGDAARAAWLEWGYKHHLL